MENSFSNFLASGKVFQDWLMEKGLSSGLSQALEIVIYIAIIIVLAWLADFITKRIIISVITRIVRKTKSTYDDIFLEKRVFNRLSHLAPALVIYYLIPIALEGSAEWIAFVQLVTSVYMIIIGLLVVDSFINALHEVYLRLPIAKDLPIKGYIQVLKIIIYLITIIWILSIVFNFELSNFFTGLGAFAAVLMLVFKDTILGFVASVQITANKMVKVGDWIEMPSRNADGTVMDITVNTVKVQNWNKTIATIPTYSLVTESFHNWKGMEESGGRRIKRSINIDMKSVKFCTQEMIERFRKIQVLSEYVNQKTKEIEEANAVMKVDNTSVVNGRRMTNLGTFRKYIEEYLKNHPKIHKDMTFLVRQLQPSDHGIPIEIYVFANDQAWANYEAIQADIFDHLLAIVPEFDLRLFQNPTGDDFRNLITD